MIAVTLVVACVLLGVSAQLTLKTGMNQVGKITSITTLISPPNIIRMFSNPYVFAGFTMYAVASILWLGALSLVNVSLLYPMLSMGYLLTAIGGHYLLGEAMPGTRWLGIVLVMGGVILITR